jgi:hypothetical protein
MSNETKRPHNGHTPIDLRDNPVCYMCGGRWKLTDTTNSVPVVECLGCAFTSYVNFDVEVWQARGWTR